MKTLRSILLMIVAGLVGLALIYTDRIPIPLGPSRVAFGSAFYGVVGYVFARWYIGRRALWWILASGWGPGVLGWVGLTEALLEPARGAPMLASLFVLGPPLSALVGARLARLKNRPAASSASRSPDLQTSD